MNKIAIFVAIIVQLGFVTSSLAEDSLPKYAPVKKNSFQSTERSKLHFSLPVAFPDKGILIAHGNILSRAAGWVIVDLDKKTLSHFSTTSQILPDGSFETIVTSRTTRLLSTEEARAIIESANTVWNGEILPAPRVTDSTCDIVLLDGESVLRLMGIGCPAGNLINVIEGLKP